jgi:hypothetical protein
VAQVTALSDGERTALLGSEQAAAQRRDGILARRAEQFPAQAPPGAGQTLPCEELGTFGAGVLRWEVPVS